MKERHDLSLCSSENSPRGKHWERGDVALLAKPRMFSSLGWTPHPSKLHHTRKNSCDHSRAIFSNKMGWAILLLINIHETWTRKASPSEVLKLGCMESWVRTHSGIPGTLLCRARELILDNLCWCLSTWDIQWFREYLTWTASSNGHQGHQLIANSTSPWGCCETSGH